MADTPKRFIVSLTAEERSRLDAHRVAMGLRSEAAVIRQWIAGPVAEDRVVMAGELQKPEPDVLRRFRTGKLDTATEAVQFGPVQAAPGSRLKKR